MDIISYNTEEVESKMARKLSASFELLSVKFQFDKNPTLTKKISKLSDQYNKYKGVYKFPSKYKGRVNHRKKTSSVTPSIWCFILKTLHFDFRITHNPLFLSNNRKEKKIN